MAPFTEPLPLINGFKERIDALHVNGDRLFIGTNLGNLHIYNVDQDDEGKSFSSLVTSKSLSKKPLEQLGYIKDINSVVALSDSLVTLYPLPDLVPPSPLQQSRKAFSFAVYSTIENVSVDGKLQSFDTVASSPVPGVPTLVTYLVIGSQRKLVIYSWRDGEAQDIKEAPLPHSARVIAFIRPTVLCLAYTATEHVLFYLETMSTAEFTMPVHIPSSISTGYGMNALSGLGGYMSLGLAAKAKPLALTIGDNVLIPKDNAGLLFGADGKSTQAPLIWNAPPEDISFVKPYVLSIQPLGSVPSSLLDFQSEILTGPTGFIQAPVLQVQSSITNQPVQLLALPTAAQIPSSLRLLCPSPSSKAPAYVISTPTDKTTATSEGSTVWMLRMRSWGEQVDELVDEEKYSEALSLLDNIEKASLPDYASRRTKIRALNAVSLFKNGEFDKAMNAFIELDINPAKIVALYPESVSGRLHIPSEQWIPLFGGPAPKPKVPRTEVNEGKSDSRVERTPSPAGSLRSIRPLRRGTLETLFSGAGTSPSSTPSVTTGNDERTSIRGRLKEKAKAADSLTRSVESLFYYLTDRRPKIGGALNSLNITPSQSHQFPFLSDATVEDLFELPNTPLSSLTPEQLTRFAQIVDTALFKAYLVIRPGLLGPLCSIPNWCEVKEVEDLLMEREKFSELVSLYKGKKMHKKALSLLKSLSDKESDIEDKIRPTVSYVQNLGPEYLDRVFEAARWIYKLKSESVFEIFTAEVVELPRSKVADFLEEELDPALCARYLEYLIDEREETSTLFHDRLAELYLEMASKAKGGDSFQEAYDKFLHFIQSTDIYRVDRLFGLLPSDDMFEARAILQGRLGRHVNALETYVYRLGDYIKAEEYCKSIYAPNSSTKDIFLSLLKIYLEPSPSALQQQKQQHSQASFLGPALDLISRQSSHLDTLETLRLLPPLVPARDVRAFLVEATRAPIFDTHVVREVRKGWSEQVGRKLMNLESRRVRITDGRICPQCHKRLGNSVIAVHAPKGEVTHYQCREAFVENKKRIANH